MKIVVDDGFMEVEFPGDVKVLVDVFQHYNAMIDVYNKALAEHPDSPVSAHLPGWAEYVSKRVVPGDVQRVFSARVADLFFTALQDRVNDLKKKDA